MHGPMDQVATPHRDAPDARGDRAGREPARQPRRAGRSGSDRVRVFIAAYPPRAHAGALLSRVTALPLPPIRAVPEIAVHLTVHFVGTVRVRELDDVRDAIEHAVLGLGGFRLTPGRLVALPEGSPRLIAAETDLPPALRELHDRLVRRLARASSGGAYHPHLTLARFEAPVAGDSASRLASLPVLDVPPFEVDHVRLVRSDLRPGGAEHVEIGRVRLGTERSSGDGAVRVVRR